MKYQVPNCGKCRRFDLHNNQRSTFHSWASAVHLQFWTSQLCQASRPSFLLLATQDDEFQIHWFKTMLMWWKTPNKKHPHLFLHCKRKSPFPGFHSATQSCTYLPTCQSLSSWLLYWSSKRKQCSLSTPLHCTVTLSSAHWKVTCSGGLGFTGEDNINTLNYTVELQNVLIEHIVLVSISWLKPAQRTTKYEIT